MLARVNDKSKHLRDKMKFHYERIPQERIDEFATTRQIDEDRTQKIVN